MYRYPKVSYMYSIRYIDVIIYVWVYKRAYTY